MTSFLLSVAPIIVLFVCLLVVKLSAKLASMITFFAAFAEFLFWVKPGSIGMAITIEKGVMMTVFVGLIAFGAMLLYNLVDVSGGFSIINRWLSNVFRDRFVLFLMISWVFSAFLQGIAGYGLPAVIATTILMKSGFPAAKAAAASLLGHSWAISFGSMGSSIFAIDLVTSTPQKEILTGMSRYGSLGMLCCGLGVCFIYGGAAFVCRGLKYVVPAWAAMTVSLMVMAEYEMVSVIGFVTGMVGVAVMMVVNRLSDRKERSMADAGQKRRLFASVLPYLLIILLSLTFFVLNPGLEISVSFPGYETLQGAVVEAKPDYVVFNILKYPFTILLLTTIASVIYYCRIGRMERKQTGLILQNTIRKIVPTEITLLFLLCTASIMMDGGMTTILSTGIVELTGSGYPFMASLIGMLGAFITGSNTNSNILFGSLQETAALSLGMEPALMCAVQSIAASVGGTIGPTTTALVAAAAGKSGQEIEIYKYTLLPTIVTAMMLGLTNIIFI